MSLDITSIVNLPFDISHTSPATEIIEAMPHSLELLEAHYKLPSIRICADIKCLNRTEYLVAEAPNFNLFVSRDGAFWSPLPVLSKADIIDLKAAGFGVYSNQPYIGDPGIVLTGKLTEMHRISEFLLFLQTLALYPKNSLEQSQRWQGMSGEECKKVESYEFRQLEENSILDVYADIELSKDLFEIKNDVFNKRTILEYRFMPQFKSYYYWAQRVYGWIYCDQYFAYDNCLLKVDKMLFNEELNVEKTTEQQKIIAEIDALLQKDIDEDNEVLLERKLKSDALQKKKDDVKREMEEFKQEQKRKEAEKEAQKKALEEQHEGEEGEAEEEKEEEGKEG